MKKHHKIWRISHASKLKALQIFQMTFLGSPATYYGDEIGMEYIEGIPSKEGGYNRTGSRTPMQWGEGKNKGFSSSDTPYLPTDSRPEAPTVEKQLHDENSLLHFVKKLIELHKTTPALQAESDINILLREYPFVYERTDGVKTIFIAINPSNNTYNYSVPAFSKVIISQNVAQNDGYITMDGVSFIVAEKL